MANKTVPVKDLSLSGRRWLMMAVSVSIAAVAVAACSSSPSNSSPSNGKASSGSSITIGVIGGPASDPWYGAFAKGLDAAGSDLGVKVDYDPLSNYTGALESQALTQVMATKPNGVVLPDLFPSALDSSIKQAVAAGTPFIMYGTGLYNYAQDGALAFIGSNLPVVGQEAAQQFLAHGVTDAICVNHIPGSPATEPECQAFIKTMQAAGKKGSELELENGTYTNAAQTTSTIQASLQSDPHINGVFSQDSNVAEDALTAIANVGRKVQSGVLNLSTQVLNQVKSGTMLFAIDQQPYLIGYLSVLSLYENIHLGMNPVGVVSTGPLIITSKTAGIVLRDNVLYPGVRGSD
jgi:simple sugar transport system substrate-binding protein